MVADPSSLRRAASFVGVIAALGLAGTAALSTLVVLPRRARVQLVEPRQTDAPRPSADLSAGLPTSVAELREAVASRTRLRPDRRALMALAELQRLVDGTAPTVTAVWRDGRWRLSLGGTDAGSLPEAADFDDLVALVAEVSASMTPLHPLAPSGGAAPEAASWPLLAPSRPSLAALTALDVAWSSGQRSPETLSAAARSLAALAVETPDALDGADLIAARALASLAWARALGRRDPEAEAVLARHMGYESAAMRAAETLPESSPVRAWARRDDDALRAMARADDARETARYLWFRRLVERREGDAARAWAERALREGGAGVAVEGFLFDALRGAPSEVTRAAVRGHAQRALLRLQREVSAGAAPVRGAADILPALVELSPRRATQGTFLDASLVTARDRAVVLSSLFEELTSALDAGATSEATTLADSLNTLAPESVRDFVLWATHVAYVSAATLAPDVLQQDLAAPLSPGAAALLRSCDIALGAFEQGDARARVSVERLATHLDARPAHRASLALRAGDALHDVALTRSCCEPTLRDIPTSDAAAWCLARRSDQDGLVAMATDATLPLSRRTLAADLAGRVRGVRADALDAAWRTILGASPASWGPREGYIRRLEAQGRTDEALALADAWLRDVRDAPPSVVASARTAAARLARARGEPQRALRAVEPALSTLDEPLLGEAARALADLGRFDDAERVAVASLEHHRSPRAVALAAEVFWRRNAYDRAARAVAQSGVALTGAQWRARVVDAFARVFSDATAQSARSAVGELVASSVSLPRLRDIPRELHRRGRSDLATVTLDALMAAQHQRAPGGDADAVVEGYLYRVPAGAPAALAWASARLDDVARPMAAPWAFSRGADALLWDLIDPPRDVAGAERVWLLRAASARRANDEGAHHVELTEHYATNPPGDEAAIGRALVARSLFAPLVASARTPRQRVEAAYFAGFDAQSLGRVIEALDWYLVTELIGGEGDPEVAWAARARDDWYERALPIERLSERPWGDTAPVTSAEAPVQLDAVQEPAPAAVPRGERAHHGHHRGHHAPRDGR
ncbi:MAG: hypothetical protein U0326_09275 [Polyangiales bacterium]